MQILITGEMRSGTKLLSNLLNSQEGIIVYRDFLLIDRLKSRMKVDWEENLSSDQKRLLISWFKTDSSKIERESEFEFDVDTACFDTLLEFYNHIIGQIGKESIIVGHKITRAHAVVSKLIELKPELRVINIIRDPRDMAVSALRFWGEIDGFKLAQQWKSSCKIMDQLHKTEKYSKRVMTIKYEDLILNTSQILRNLSDFLQITHIEIPSFLSDYDSPWDGNSSFGTLGKVLDPSPIGRWKDSNLGVVKCIEVALNKQIKLEKYELNRSFSLLDKVKFKANYWVYLALGLISKIMQRIADELKTLSIKFSKKLSNIN